MNHMTHLLNDADMNDCYNGPLVKRPGMPMMPSATNLRSTFTTLALAAVCIALLPGASAQDASTNTEAVASAGSLDMVWLFLCACLVFLMQAGFALLGAGAVRSKNAVNYLVKSLMDFGLGAIVFFLVGYALMFGAGDLVGTTGFGLAGAGSEELMFFLFQVMFAATAATIVAGAVAERMKLGAYVIYTVAITAIIYPVFGHWVWGGGFLAAAGFTDFAGSGVVHAVGGLLALVAAAILGPRHGRYGADGRARPMPGHNQVYVVLGTLLLFFGWFGFNTGSTLAAGDASIPLIAVNTFLAGAAGATAVFLYRLPKGRVEIGDVCNGMLAGLVAITAPCAFVTPAWSLVIGGVGGLVYLAAAALLTHRIRVDDPVGAIAVHGVTGIWGVLAVGLFATQNGVAGLIAGNGGQLITQLYGVGVLLAWTLGSGYLLFKGIDLAMGLRIGAKEEQAGLDSFHHSTAYPEVVANKPSPRKGTGGRVALRRGKPGHTTLVGVINK